CSSRGGPKRYNFNSDINCSPIASDYSNNSSIQPNLGEYTFGTFLATHMVRRDDILNVVTQPEQAMRL
ncbi:MAG TPA: hypothetical protein VGD99_13280, partial [Anaerolineae bacterium]